MREDLAENLEELWTFMDEISPRLEHPGDYIREIREDSMIAYRGDKAYLKREDELLTVLENEENSYKLSEDEEVDLDDLDWQSLSQGDLAQFVGVSRPTIGYIERKETDQPKEEVSNRISEVLGIPDYFEIGSLETHHGYTEKGVLKEIRDLNEDNTGNLTARDHPSLRKAAEEFYGSWNEAKENAEVETVNGNVWEGIQNEAVEKFNNGDSTEEIAKSLGLSETPVLRALKESDDASISVRDYDANFRAFAEIDSETAYWLGFIYADGSVYTNKNNYRLSIRLSSRDIDHIRDFKSFMDAEHPVFTHDYGEYGETEGGMVAGIALSSPELIEDLEQWGIHQNKVNDLQWPEKLPERYSRDFIRGLFDGDGWVTAVNDEELAWGLAGYEPFLDEVKSEIETGIGRSAGIIFDEELRYSGNDIVPEIFVWTHGDADQFLERKVEVVDEFEKEYQSVSQAEEYNQASTLSETLLTRLTS